MKIIRFLVIALVLAVAVPSSAKAFELQTQQTMAQQILNYKYVSYLEFKENNNSFYKSNHFNIEENQKLPFEIALESDEVERGEWSMHVTTPTPPQFKYDVVDKKKLDIASQILYVGMRYKFEK